MYWLDTEYRFLRGLDNHDNRVSCLGGQNQETSKASGSLNIHDGLSSVHTHSLSRMETHFPHMYTDPSIGNNGNSMSSMKTHEMLEEENDRMVEQMAGKVAALKSVS